MGEVVYCFWMIDTAERDYIFRLIIVTGELIDDTLRIVTNGLAKDETFVTQALMKVHEGMVVAPVRSPSK